MFCDKIQQGHRSFVGCCFDSGRFLYVCIVLLCSLTVWARCVYGAKIMGFACFAKDLLIFFWMGGRNYYSNPLRTLYALIYSAENGFRRNSSSQYSMALSFFPFFIALSIFASIAGVLSQPPPCAPLP